MVDNCDNTVVLCLIGNKCDLPNREVTFDEGQEYANKHGLFYIEISAKTGLNVNDTFQMVVTRIYKTLHGDENYIVSNL